MGIVTVDCLELARMLDVPPARHRWDSAVIAALRELLGAPYGAADYYLQEREARADALYFGGADAETAALELVE